MPRGINKVILIGNLGDEPLCRTTHNGTSVTNISMVTNEMRRSMETGEYTEFAEWHRVVMWGRLADIAKQYLHKGSQVYIEGKLRTRSYLDKQGQKRSITEIVADEMQMLGGRAQGAAAPAGAGMAQNGYARTPSYGQAASGYGQGGAYGQAGAGYGQAPSFAPAAAGVYGTAPAPAEPQGAYGSYASQANPYGVPPAAAENPLANDLDVPPADNLGAAAAGAAYAQPTAAGAAPAAADSNKEPQEPPLKMSDDEIPF